MIKIVGKHDEEWNDHSFQNMWIRVLVQVVCNATIEGLMKTKSVNAHVPRDY